MKKLEFIEKYGEEAWERKKEYDKQYRDTHKKETKEYRKKYYEENKDRIKKQGFKYRKENKDSIKEKSRSRYVANRQKILEYAKEYYEENKDKKIRYSKGYYQSNKDVVLTKQKLYRDSTNCNKKYRATKEGRATNLINDYSRYDKQAGRGSCTLTRDWIIENIFNSKCIYCGDSDWRHLGCDRIDNNLPHTKNNCVCSCGLCNMERADRFTVEEFVEYRKTHPRELNTHTTKKNIIEIDGVKIIRKSIGL